MKTQSESDYQIDILQEIIVDNFAGGGGASTGIELASGRTVAIAINHDPDAILMHKTNHPYTEHLQASVWDVDPVAVCRGRPVGLAWFSPDCKHFSKAKGAALVDRNIRGLAWIVLRWAAQVRPRVIMLENVEEFQTWGPVRKGKPVKSKAGQTFRKWKQQLEDLGYVIEHRELVAADYGAPTIRKRYYGIFRCDGKPIVWPEPTHSKTGADGKKKWRSAAEVIDWSLPCPSIFESKAEIKAKYGLTAVRPLADNTLKRAIQGTDKFTIKSGNQFLVDVNHKGEFRGQSINEPVDTITAKLGRGVVHPVVTAFTQTNTSNSVGTSPREPVNTARTDGGGGQMLITPSLTAIGQTSTDGREYTATEPVRTVVSKAEQCLISPILTQYHDSPEFRGQPVIDPIMTIDGSNRYGLETAQLTEFYGNGNALDVSQPMHTITSKDREALTLAHIAEFKGQDKGQSADEPLRTITASVGEFATVYAKVVRYTPDTDMGYWPEIRALLNKYCGYKLADDEVILLHIRGSWYYISDIGLRMLTPRELYNAMGFLPDYCIDFDVNGKPYSKAEKVARCGNAVCPAVSEALVRDNFQERCCKKITTMAQLDDAVAV